MIPQLDGPAKATLSLSQEKEVLQEEPVEEEAEPDIFKMAENGWPETKLIESGVNPPSMEFHPQLGISTNPSKTERYGTTWWEFTLWSRGVGYIERYVQCNQTLVFSLFCDQLNDRKKGYAIKTQPKL